MYIEVRNLQKTKVQNTSCAPDSAFHLCTFLSCSLWYKIREDRETRKSQCAPTSV